MCYRGRVQEMDYQREGINMIKFTETMATMPEIVIPEVCFCPPNHAPAYSYVTRSRSQSYDWKLGCKHTRPPPIMPCALSSSCGVSE